MPSGWDVYYLIFFSAAMALLIPIGLWGLSRLFFTGSKPRRRQLPSADMETDEESRGRQTLGNRVNVRFFLAVNASLVLIALILGIIPPAAAVRAGATEP